MDNNQRNNDFVMPEVDEMMDYVARERQKAQVSKTISLSSPTTKRLMEFYPSDCIEQMSRCMD